MHFRFYFLSLFFICISSAGLCQNYMTKNGFIGFYSKTPLEDIRGGEQSGVFYTGCDQSSYRIRRAPEGFYFPKRTYADTLQ